MTEQEEKEYMEEWAEWMNAPLGIPKKESELKEYQEYKRESRKVTIQGD